MSSPSWGFTATRALTAGLGSASRLAEHLSGLGVQRPLIVTDRGVLAAGILDGAAESLRRSQVAFEVYDETVADPPADQVHAAAGQARAMRADGVVGFGGGSSMDIAKLVALLASPGCTQPLDDMFGVGNVRAARLPLVQVPTTAGTGSEVTPIAIITTAPGTKQGVVSPQLLPDLAVLDGELTASLPPHVAAATGVCPPPARAESRTCP